MNKSISVEPKDDTGRDHNLPLFKERSQIIPSIEKNDVLTDLEVEQCQRMFSPKKELTIELVQNVSQILKPEEAKPVEKSNNVIEPEIQSSSTPSVASSQKKAEVVGPKEEAQPAGQKEEVEPEAPLAEVAPAEEQKQAEEPVSPPDA